MEVTDRSMEKLYRTSDIYFAAYLCCMDFVLVTTEDDCGGDGRKKVVFVFKLRTDHLQRAKAKYFGNSATVKAKGYVDNIRSLKSMCYV